MIAASSDERRAIANDEATAFLIAAARLRARARRWERKRAAQRKGRRLIFFVDNDVVTLYTNPARTGNIPYGMIFPNDSKKEATEIAALLGEYVFEGIGCKTLLQFPSHAEELASILETVSQEVVRPPNWLGDLNDEFVAQEAILVDELSLVGNAEITQASQRLFAPSRASDAREDEEAVGILLERLFTGQSSSLQLTRFLGLLSKARIAPVDAAPAGLIDDLPAFCRKALNGPTDVQGMVNLSIATNRWFELLNAQKRADTKADAIERDARALSYLEFINHSLRESKYQACLITGDSAIWRLALTSEQQLSEWLINPRSMIVEALDSWAERQSDGAFRFALQSILAPFSQDEIELLSKNRTKARTNLATQLGGVDSSVSELYNEKIERWETVKATLIQERVLNDSGYRPLFSDFIQRIVGATARTVEKKLEELHRRVDVLLTEEWRKLEEDFSRIGITLLLAFRNTGPIRPWRPRNPPIVMFERYPETDQLARLLLRERHGSASLVDQLQRIGDDGKSDAERRYLTFLVYAILSASEGRWHVARTFAGRAFAIGDSQRRAKEASPLDGREALFVMAQAERCLVRQEADLQVAQEFLNRARELLSGEGGEPFEQIKRIRFDCEDIAIALAGLHFKTWIARVPLPDAELESVFSIIRNADRAIHEIKAPEASGRDEKKILDTLAGYVFINCVQLAHLDLYHNKRIRQSLSAYCRHLWKDRNKVSDKGSAHPYHDSFLIMSYDLFFRNIVMSEPSSGLLASLDTKANIDDYGVTIYDAKRFNNLFRIVRRSL